MLAEIGKFISPLFTPLGFNDGGFGWQFSVASLSGIVAKETVVTTLEILLPVSVDRCISDLGAYCFVTYNLLTAPCIATISASFTELGGFRQGIKTVAFQIVTAYVVTFVLYQVGTLFAEHTQTAIIIAVTAAAIILLTLASIRSLKGKCRYGDCAKCGACKRR